MVIIIPCQALLQQPSANNSTADYTNLSQQGSTVSKRRQRAVDSQPANKHSEEQPEPATPCRARWSEQSLATLPDQVISVQRTDELRSM